MLDKIRELLAANVELTSEDIMQIFYEIGAQGDIILLKNDGFRNADKFTVVILFAGQKFDSIRMDHANLNAALTRCLQEYFAILDKKG